MRRWVPGRKAAERTEYRSRLYTSKAEARYARDLDLRVAAREIAGWDPQWPIDLTTPDGRRVWRHWIDFRVRHTDGSVELVEIKGFAEEDWKLKRKVLEMLILPTLQAEAPTRYTVLDRTGRPWTPPKRPGKRPSVTA